jgi:hypothetical protein
VRVQAGFKWLKMFLLEELCKKDNETSGFINGGKCLGSWATMSFSRRTLI